MSSSSRLIKKYDNRKLYCTTSSAYVTLLDIANFIKAGETVKVECNKQKTDITGEVLKSVIATQDVSVADLISLIKR